MAVALLPGGVEEAHLVLLLPQQARRSLLLLLHLVREGAVADVPQHHLLLLFYLHLAAEVDVVEGGIGGYSAEGVLLQHLRQQVQDLGAELGVHLLPHVEVAGAVLAQDLVVLLALEDGAAEEEVVEDDPGGEDVANGLALGAHVADVDDFGRHEAGSAAADEEVLLLVGVGGESEVADGEVAGVVLAEHDVLGLEVAVDDAVLGEVAESAQNILDDGSDLVGLQLLGALEEVVELAALQVLQDHVDGVFGLVDALQLHDVGVAESPHQFDLVFQGLPALVAGVLLLLREGLHRHHLVVPQPFRQVYGCERALPDFLLRLEKLMEVSLVYLLFQFQTPALDDGGVHCLEGEGLGAVLALQPEGEGQAEHVFVLHGAWGTSSGWQRSSNLRSKARRQQCVGVRAGSARKTQLSVRISCISTLLTVKLFRRRGRSNSCASCHTPEWIYSNRWAVDDIIWKMGF